MSDEKETAKPRAKRKASSETTNETPDLSKVPSPRTVKEQQEAQVATLGPTDTFVSPEYKSPEDDGKSLADTKSVESPDSTEGQTPAIGNKAEPELDSTAKSVEDKAADVKKAVDAKVGEDTSADRFPAPEGTVFKDGEDYKIPTEELDDGARIATEDVYLESRRVDSARPYYTLLAVKGSIVTDPVATGTQQV